MTSDTDHLLTFLAAGRAVLAALGRFIQAVLDWLLAAQHRVIADAHREHYRRDHEAFSQWLNREVVS